MSGRKKSGKGEPFVMLQHYLLKSPAWQSLPADAVKVLLDVWRRHNGANNGEISYGVREAAEIGITKTPAGRMLNVLVDRGFLAVIRDGGFNVGNRKTRTWRLTAETYHDQKATKDFMRWKPDENAPKKKRRRSTAPPQNSDRSPCTGTISPCAGTKVIKLPGTVPAQGLKTPESPPNKSLCRDTYNIPYVPKKARGGVTAQEPDPAARAKRRDLDDYDLGGGPVLLADVVADVVDAAVWDAWLNRLAGYAGRAFSVQAMIEAREAVEEARTAGSREASPPHIRKVLNELDKADPAERIRSNTKSLGVRLTQGIHKPTRM